MAVKTTALVLITDDKVKISYHEDKAEADTAADKVASFDHGFSVDSIADIEPDDAGEGGMDLDRAHLVIDKLGGIEGANTEEITDVDSAREYVWRLLLQHLPDNPEYEAMYGAESAAEAPDDEEEEAAVPDPEEIELSDTNIETPAPRKRPAPAPRKAAPAPKKAAAPKPAPAPKKAVAAKPAPAAKVAVPVKAAKPVKAIKAAAEAAKKSAAPKKAAGTRTPKTTKGPDEYRISEKWKPILRELGKKKAGLLRPEFIELSVSMGGGHWFGRYRDAGIIERLDNGRFVLTDAGRAALAK